MLSLADIFSSSKFADESFDRPRWSAGSFFTTLRKIKATNAGVSRWSVPDLTATSTSAACGGLTLSEIMWHDAKTGSVEPLVVLEQLVPSGHDLPIAIDDYEISADRSKILIFTESQKVWRVNTRGSYWLLDLASGCAEESRLVQLGHGLSNRKGLMFATFSPDGRKVAYVFEHNIYVEDLETHALIPLTSDGNDNIINGTFDWVYEEEFHMYCGFRWAPDSSSIVYWRLDQSDVPIVNLINNTDGTYPKITPIRYPRAGDTNASVRIGVVPASGGHTLWINVPGDPRNDYIADISFHRNTGKIVMQQLNRLQNTLRVLLANPADGAVTCVFEDRDDAWIDISHELQWLPDGNAFFFLTDRNNWRQILLVTLDTVGGASSIEYLTPEGTDVVSLAGYDTEDKFAYYIASPADPLRRYLYRVKVNGSNNVRVTPEEDALTGTNSYTLSKDGKFAVHCFSSQSQPPVYSIVSLPNHSICISLASNDRLSRAFKELSCAPIEFIKVFKISKFYGSS